MMLWFRGSHAKAREQAPWLEWLPDKAFWHDFEAPCQAADRTSADQQATLRVDSRQSLGAVRAVFRAWSNPAVLLYNEMDVVLLIGFWQRGWMLR
jgi:hypothetical protein